MGSLEDLTALGFDVAAILAQTGFGSVNEILDILGGGATLPILPVE